MIEVNLYTIQKDMKLRRDELITQLNLLKYPEDEYLIGVQKGRIFELEKIFWDLFPKDNITLGESND